MTLSGKTAFVTGGSGFIGGRLIEVLTGQMGMRVRTLVRATTSAGGGAFRAAAAGAEMVFGSLLDEDLLERELAGADIVFHCAYGMHGSNAEQREVTVEGTRKLARAAAKAGVKHFINLGTVASYGDHGPALVPEDYEDPNLWAWPYAHDKRDAEKALAEVSAATGLPFTVLRLGAVYGPYGGSFTVMPINTLLNGRNALVDDGAGISNATYVDDVVQAMLRAAMRKGTGQRYMIRGPDSPTWRQFYEAYEAMIGGDALVAMSGAEMKAARRAEWMASA
ncbi:MAG: NAD-dependent epimerase/dehydratase family protein, partial [Novosphingobium sp.]